MLLIHVMELGHGTLEKFLHVKYNQLQQSELQLLSFLVLQIQEQMIMVVLNGS